MLYALVYWLLRRLIGPAAGSLGSRHNDVEVLVLRHPCVPQLWWSPGTRIGGLTCGNAWWIAARACY